MLATTYILAQPLAPDNIWFALLLVAALALLHGLGSLRARVIQWRRTWHPLHGISYKWHDHMTHRHH